MKISDNVLGKIKGNALLSYMNAPPDMIIPASVTIEFAPAEEKAKMMEIGTLVESLVRGTNTRYKILPHKGRATFDDVSMSTLAGIMEVKDFVTEACMKRDCGKPNSPSRGR